MTEDEVRAFLELKTTNELYKLASLNFQAACVEFKDKLRILQEKYDAAISDKAVAENGQQALQRSLDFINAEIIIPLGLANEGLRRDQATHADSIAKMSRRNTDLVTQIGNLRTYIEDLKRALELAATKEGEAAAERKQLYNRINDVRSKSEALERENAQLKGTLAAEREKFDLESSELRATLAARNSALKAIEEREKELKATSGMIGGWYISGELNPPKILFSAQHEPAPSPSAMCPVLPYVRERLNERAAEGRAKYGTDLCLFNHRDGVNDAAEEVLDAVQYLVQVQAEQKLLASREGYEENGVRVRLHNSRLTFHVPAERLRYRRFISATEQTTVKDLILKAGGYGIDDMHDHFFVSVGPEVNIAKFVRDVLDALRVDANANAKTA